MSVIGVDSSYYVDIVENLPVNSNRSPSKMFSNQRMGGMPNDKKPDPSTGQILEDDLLVVALWTAMGIFGLLTNVLILAGICQSKKLRQSTSYWLITSLSFCDIGMLVVCLAHLIPATVLHERYVKIIDFSNSFGVFVYDAFWYTGVLHLMVMSINRYVNICRPKHYLKLFSHGKTMTIIFLLYCMGVALAAPGLFSCCYLVFNYNFYAGQYEPADTPYRYVDMAVNGSSVVIMTFCYICIVVRVRRSRIMLQQYRKLCREQTKTALVYAKSSNGRQNSVATKLARLLRPHGPIASRREVRLFFQFATVSVIFFLTFFTWSWLPHLSSDSKWIGFAVTSLFFVNNSINPIVYLIFNSVLRRQIQKMFCPFSGGGSSTTGQREPDETVRTNQQEPDRGTGPGVIAGQRHLSLLRRLRSSGSMRERRKRDEYLNNRQMRRRSTAFDPDDFDPDARLLRTSLGSYNDTSDAGTENNNTCNLMAMAAFLNTTTITGGVLLKTIQEDEERRKLVPHLHLVRQSTDAASGSETRSMHDSVPELDKLSEGESTDGENGSGEDLFELQDSYFELPYINAILTDDETSIHL